MASLTSFLLLLYIAYLHYLIEVRAPQLSPVRTLWSRLAALVKRAANKLDSNGR